MNFEMLKQNIKVRAFGLAKIPLIFACRPKIIELTTKKVRLIIPLNWFTKNHHGSMYFGALCIGADIAGGLIAMKLIEESGKNIGLIFKDFKGHFLKRPEGDVEFICEDGQQIEQLVQETLMSTDRQFLAVTIRASVPSVSAEVVAEFVLTLALKKR